MDTAPCTTLYTTSAQRAHNVDTTSYTTLRTTFYTTLCAVFHICLDMTEYIGVGEQHNLWQSMFVGSSSRSQLCEPRPLNAWHCGAWTPWYLKHPGPLIQKVMATNQAWGGLCIHNVPHNVAQRPTQRPTQRPYTTSYTTSPGNFFLYIIVE